MWLRQALEAIIELIDERWQHDVSTKEGQILNSLVGMWCVRLAKDGRKGNVL